MSTLTRPYKEKRCLQVLRNTVGLNSSLGLFALCKTLFIGLHTCINIDKVNVYAGLVSIGFLCKVAQEMTTGDKGKLFVLFVPLFTLSLLSKIVCSLKKGTFVVFKRFSTTH